MINHRNFITRQRTIIIDNKYNENNLKILRDRGKATLPDAQKRRNESIRPIFHKDANNRNCELRDVLGRNVHDLFYVI